jgi:hypothetical protein
MDHDLLCHNYAHANSESSEAKITLENEYINSQYTEIG